MLRLMLAEDEQYERDYLEKVIKESYPTLLDVVCKAANGVELLEQIERCEPQIILLDIKMPRMDGLETAEKIREIYPDAQMVIVSAYGDFAYAKQAMKLGISEYLLKPYMDSELMEVLDRVIARIREREDTLSMLSYSGNNKEWNYEKDIDKDLLWNLFFGKVYCRDVFKVKGIEKNWVKVVLISSAALSHMGDFSKKVLENYFRKEGVVVLNSIWMNQMAICLFSDHKESFTEVNSCIKRARDYLAQEHQIAVNCGVSGVYSGSEFLTEAYEEAVSFIVQFSELNEKELFQKQTKHMKTLCHLEKEITAAMVKQDKDESQKKLTQLVEILEEELDYQDVPVKLNFGRSLLTVFREINQNAGIMLEEEEVLRQLGMLEQLNFNGDNLKYYMDFFADVKVSRIKE